MRTEFKKMTLTQQNYLSGGFNWLVLLFPYVIKSLVSSVSAIKMLQSDNGSVKYKDWGADWSTNKSSASNTKVKEYFYAI